ncbi:MAG: SigE family RNA polymerase sigma factor [Pseudonocardiales bacterium]|nr:MAG: SigE family RNA polymerase sigma factor [Pseudonocardiales bacterium]
MPDVTAESRDCDVTLRERSPDRNELRSEFAAFYEDAYPRLVSQVRAIIGDPAAAPEAVQHAMARAWIQWRRLRHLDDSSGWVRRAALRNPRPQWRFRRLAVRPRLSEDELASMDSQHLAVLYALLQQPETERRSLVLRYMAGMSVASIAEEEGVAMDTILARIRRGGAAVAELLVDEGDGDKR